MNPLTTAQEPQDDQAVHCTHCGRVLTAEESVARELGPICHRHLTQGGHE